MQIALVADLHGNMPATKALEADIKNRKIKHIYCMGDLVGKGPSSAQTMDWAFANCEIIIGGNWDSGISKKHFEADGYYWNQLGQGRLDKLKALPLEHHFYFSGRHVRLLHGRNVMPELLNITSPKEELQALFQLNHKKFDIVGYSDTHRAFYRTMQDGILFNTGSVGNALGLPMVCYAILNGEMGKNMGPIDISLVSLPYDNEAAVRDAMADPLLPHKEAYINEVRTGIYSR